MPASRAPALGEPSQGLSRRQPRDGSRWDGALAARRRGGGEASLAGCARQRERPAGILPATAAASCDSRPSRSGDFLLARLSCEAIYHAGWRRASTARYFILASSALTFVLAAAASAALEYFRARGHAAATTRERTTRMNNIVWGERRGEHHQRRSCPSPCSECLTLCSLDPRS